MASGRANKLTGAVGEFLVAAELCRRGLIATPFAGNVPHYDIIASGQLGGHVAVQVKAINERTWQFYDIRKFLDVQVDKDSGRQTIGELQSEPFPGLICVLVTLKETEEERDRFFILEWKELRDALAQAHIKYLSKHDFVRPRNPDSFHVALAISDVVDFENKWPKILDRVAF